MVQVGDKTLRQVCHETISHFKVEGKWHHVPIVETCTFDENDKVLICHEYQKSLMLTTLKSSPFASFDKPKTNTDVDNNNGSVAKDSSKGSTLIEISKQIKKKLFEDRDVAAACQFLTDDVSYELVPYESKTVGREHILKSFSTFADWIQDGRFELVTAFESTTQDGDLTVRKVCMERISHFKAEDKWFSVPVCDIMTFNQEDKVTSWREYHTLDYLAEVKNPPF